MDESSANYLSQAGRQALGARRRLIENKDIVPYSVLQEELGRERLAFEKATRDCRILMLCVDGQYYFPAFYLDGSIDHVHLGSVVKSLGELDPWTKWQFFTTPKLTLNGETPLEALRKGKLESVLNAAGSFLEL